MLALLTLLPASAQAAMPAAAYVDDSGLVIYRGGVQHQVSASPTNLLNLRWSDSGEYLAFQRYNSANALITEVLNASSGERETISETSTFLPAAFDGGDLIYGEIDPDAEPGPLRAVTLYRRPVTGGETQAIGTIEVGVGCGGGSPFPMDAVYNAEAGFGGRPLTLEATDAGILFSMNCAGIGLSLLDAASGEVRVLGDSLSRGIIGPAGDRVAAVDEGNGQLVVVTLTSGERRALAASRPVDQITWDNDGSALYYSTRTLMDLPLPLSDDEAGVVARTLGLPADGIPQYVASITRITLNGSQESVVFEEPAWAVGRMQDGSDGLYASLISNGEAWVEALTNGTIDPLSPESFQQAWRSVPVTLVRVGGGQVAEVREGIHLFRLHPTAR
jgi:hypothetical protein